MRSYVHLKVIILSALLFTESLFLTGNLLAYVRSQDYFTPPVFLLIKICLLMLTITYTISLTLAAWNKWEQYLIVPLPLSFGIFLMLIPINYIHALIVFILITLLLIYNVSRATTIKNLLIKIKPTIALKPIIKGTFFVISITAATIVLINPSTGSTHDIALKVGEIAALQVEKLISRDDQIQPFFRSGDLDLSFQEQITTEIDNFLTPYRQLLTPAMAAFTFALLQGLTTLVYIIYILTIDLIFVLAKKFNFFKVATEDVKKETLFF